MEYNPSDPHKTLPTPKSTDTQRFQPVRHPDATIPPVGTPDLEKTAPNLRVAPFPEHPVAKAEVPPGHGYDATKTFEYGGITLHRVTVHPNGDREGTDENGIRFVIPKAEWKSFEPDFNE